MQINVEAIALNARPATAANPRQSPNARAENRDRASDKKDEFPAVPLF